MKKNNLLSILRADFANHIRDKHIKEECENCGSKIELNLHHEFLFKEQLKYTLCLLQLNNKELFTIEDVKKIRLIMLGLQSINNYKTLCKNCHTIKHLAIIKKTEEDKLKFTEMFLKYIDMNCIDKLIYEKKDKNIILNKADNLGLKKDNGHKHSFNSLLTYLIKEGYEIQKKRIMIEGKQYTTYYITKEMVN